MNDTESHERDEDQEEVEHGYIVSDRPGEPSTDFKADIGLKRITLARGERPFLSVCPLQSPLSARCTPCWAFLAEPARC